MATVATINELGSYSHNPRGNLWFNDESSYGKKMLLKMGWRKGKGLGKKEDGIKENLKVKFKNTNTGLGYKDDSYTNVMKTEYESILKSLSAVYSQEQNKNVCKTSEENQVSKQKSRIIKSKIRYPKLYYGKDVSKYSEKDMKSIFICSFPSQTNEENEFKASELSLKEEPEDSRLVMKEESENQFPKLQGTHTSHLSISDYFSMKMKEKKGNEQKEKYSSKMKQYETGSNKISYENTGSNIQSDEMCEVDHENKDDLCLTEDIVLSSNVKRHKKKHKHLEMSMSDEIDKNMLHLEENERIKSSSSKKQKKLAKYSSFDQDFPEDKMQENGISAVDQLSVSHKKRKKSHKSDSFSSINTVELSSHHSDNDADILPNKKRKKSHKNDDRNGIALLSVSLLKDEVPTNNEIVNNISTVGLGEVTSDNLINIDNNSLRKEQKKLKNKNNSLKKLKSCLKNKKSEYSVKNVSFNETISFKIIESSNESTGSLSDCKDKIQTDFELSASDDNLQNENNTGDNKSNVQQCISEHSDNNRSNTTETVSEKVTEECVSLASLPSSESSYYNSWVESQQQALKMKLYKDLLKAIKKDNVLKTTNLSFIKGYGNWGF